LKTRPAKPNSKPPQEAGKTTTILASEQFKGPLPHPDIFKKYGEIVPDAPERILRDFEETSRVGREAHMDALHLAAKESRRVQWMAFTLILSGFVMSVLFAWMDRDVLSATILGTTICAIVYGFLKKDKPPE
jgi:uncharacterized membrane protein